jgi:hypothetical protein
MSVACNYGVREDIAARRSDLRREQATMTSIDLLASLGLPRHEHDSRGLLVGRHNATAEAG